MTGWGGRMCCVMKDSVHVLDTNTSDCPLLHKIVLEDKYGLPIGFQYSLKVAASEIWISTKVCFDRIRCSVDTVDPLLICAPHSWDSLGPPS